MHKLRKFYYDNKEKIWGIIIFIVLVLASIQIINRLISIQNENDLKQINENSISNNTYSDNRNTYITNDESVVTGEKVNETDLQDANEIIEKFISECNNGNIEQAYNLISTDCKNEMYQDINAFKTMYYDVIFNENTKKIATIENFIMNTYIVNISDDIMVTGNNSEKKQDYITIVEENEELKLNINNYIGKEEINIEQSIDNIKFDVIEKHIYVDYEIYKLKITNQSDDNIILDTLQNPKAIYLQDENEIKYYAYSNELIDSMLKVNKNFSTEINVKFSKSYNSSEVKINSIIFSEVILNNNESNKKIIEIDL